MNKSVMPLLFSGDHELYYSNRPDLMPSASEIGDAIKALDRIIGRDLVEVLSGLRPDLRDLSIELQIEAIETGSIKMLFKIIGMTPEEAGDIIHNRIKKIPKIGAVMNNRELVAWLTLATVLGISVSTAVWTMGKIDETVSSASGGDSIAVQGDYIHIEGQYNALVNKSAEAMDIDPQDLKKSIENVAKRKATRDAAIKLIEPIRRDPDGEIRLNGNRETTLAPNVIKVMPSSPKIPSDTRTATKDNVRVEIRASDLDDPKRWAALIPSLSTERHPLRLRISRTLPMAGVVWLDGNVIVEYERDDDGEEQVKGYELISVHQTNLQNHLHHDPDQIEPPLN